MRFYRDVLGFPVVHSICAAGWGPEDHPDFIHFFFDIGNDDRIAFFYYFGARAGDQRRGGREGRRLRRLRRRRSRSSSCAPATSRSTSTTRTDLLEYRRRLDESAWPVEMQIQHETIESIYTHDPNGYMFEITRAMRPVTPQEDLDANLTIDALLDVVAEPEPTFGKLLARKAELIVERAAEWELRAPGMTTLYVLDVPENTRAAQGGRGGPGRRRRAGSGRTSRSARRGPIVIDRRATGCRHAVWYSSVAAVARDSRIVQHDKDALRVEPA